MWPYPWLCLFKVIQYFMFTCAFMFVLGGSFSIMLPLCNPVIPPLAVSCFKICFCSLNASFSSDISLILNCISFSPCACCTFRTYSDTRATSKPDPLLDKPARGNQRNDVVYVVQSVSIRKVLLLSFICVADLLSHHISISYCLVGPGGIDRDFSVYFNLGPGSDRIGNLHHLSQFGSFHMDLHCIFLCIAIS